MTAAAVVETARRVGVSIHRRRAKGSALRVGNPVSPDVE